MITYTAGELLALQPTDVTILRTVRKSIFGFILWRPRKQQVQRHEGVLSRGVLPPHRHSWSRSVKRTYGGVHCRQS